MPTRRTFLALPACLLLPAPRLLAAANPRREQLVKLLRDLADEAIAKFFVQDPNRRVFGMGYEFLSDGKPAQVFALDAMHDTAWLTSALVTAHRIDPAGAHLRHAQRLGIPFITNVLTNSDRLFPHMAPNVEYKEERPFAAPFKGWAPRGWDDGPGIEMITGKPFSDAAYPPAYRTIAVERDAAGHFLHTYYTGSNHLLQDLVDCLLNAWLTTRDPALAQAILHVHEGRVKYDGNLLVVRIAAGLTNNQPELSRRAGTMKFDPAEALWPLWPGLVEAKALRVNFYSDIVAWSTRQACARAALTGEPMPPVFVASAIGQMYATLLTAQAFHAKNYQPGMGLTHLTSPLFKDGELTAHSDDRTLFEPRCLEIAWIAAALLGEFTAHPDAWNAAMADLKQQGTLDPFKQRVAAMGVEFHEDPAKVAAYLEDTIDRSIDYWAAVRAKIGYLPRGRLVSGAMTQAYARTPELGGYAHLIKLIAFRLMHLDGVTDRQLISQQAPATPLLHDPLPDSVLKIQGLKN